ncbi:MAG: hypothetical protein ACYTF6_07975 [Planctomycetota bacterium]|jgi:hypothetical protein
MTDKTGEFVGGISALARMEEQIAASLAATSNEVSRAECFDDEQRSEVYAILAALKADSKAHRNLVGRWVNDRTGGVANV